MDGGRERGMYRGNNLKREEGKIGGGGPWADAEHETWDSARQNRC